MPQSPAPPKKLLGRLRPGRSRPAKGGGMALPAPGRWWPLYGRRLAMMLMISATPPAAAFPGPATGRLYRVPIPMPISSCAPPFYPPLVPVCLRASTQRRRLAARAEMGRLQISDHQGRRTRSPLLAPRRRIHRSSVTWPGPCHSRSGKSRN